MSRYFSLSLILFLLLIEAAFAQAQPVKSSNQIGDAVRFRPLVQHWRLQLKTYEDIFDHGCRFCIHAPEEGQLRARTLDAIKRLIHISETRKYIFGRMITKYAGDFGTSDNDFQKKFHVYFDIASQLQDIQSYLDAAKRETHQCQLDYCRSYPKKYKKIARDKYQSLIRKYGHDPKKYYRELAATLRPKVWAPFRIGKITIEDKDWINRSTDAGRTLLDAKNELHSALKALKERQAEYKEQELKYWQTYEDLRVRIRPLRRAYEAAIAPAVKAEKARVAGLSRRADADIRKIRKRIDQIDRHLPLLDSTFTGPNAAQYAAERRKALLAERATLQTKLSAISAQTKPKAEPRLRENSQDAKALYERWQREKRYSDQRMAQAGRDLEDAARRRDRDENDVAHAESALDKAIAAWNAAQRDQTVRLAQISSDDFRAHFLTHPPDIPALNSLINELRRGLRQAEATHAEARRRMLRQADVVELAGNALLHSAYKSLAGQAAVELALEAKSLFEAGKEGPYAVLAQAYTDLAWNVFSPPTYYDGQPKDLPIGATAVKALARAPTAGKQAVSGYGAKQSLAHYAKTFSKATQRRLAKPYYLQAGNKVTREAVRHLRAKGMLRGADQYVATREEVQRLRERLVSRMASLKKITADLDHAIVEAEAKGIAKTVGAQLAKGILKGAATAVAKDVAKREIAQMVEGPALSHYLAEELILSKAVRVMFNTSAMANDLRQTLAIEEKTREELLNRYDSASGAYVEKNRQFLAEGGYAFYLYSSEDDKESGKRDASRQLKARVFLQGIELKQEPSPHGLKFVIRSGDEARFNTPALPEKLPLTVTLQ